MIKFSKFMHNNLKPSSQWIEIFHKKLTKSSPWQSNSKKAMKNKPIISKRVKTNKALNKLRLKIQFKQKNKYLVHLKGKNKMKNKRTRHKTHNLDC